MGLGAHRNNLKTFGTLTHPTVAQVRRIIVQILLKFFLKDAVFGEISEYVCLHLYLGILPTEVFSQHF